MKKYTIELSKNTYNELMEIKENLKDNPKDILSDDDVISIIIPLTDWALIYK
jgi:hypothetical protein